MEGERREGARKHKTRNQRECKRMNRELRERRKMIMEKMRNGRRKWR